MVKYQYAEYPLKGKQLECCAILHNGVCYVIAAPASHDDVIQYMKERLYIDYNETTCTLGFLTDKSEFLTLTEGYIFAVDNEQVANGEVYVGDQ